MQSLRGTTWGIRARAPQDVFAALPDVPPLAVQILHNRGHDSPGKVREFLQGPPPPYDPYLLDGMEPAVARLLKAAGARERVCVYGDFDVDGVTSAALLVEALGMLGCDAFAYIPDRLSEGYGLNTQAIDAVRADHADLLVTADCGTNSATEIAHAVAQGLDVIVTDHHVAGSLPPGALAVLNPNRPGGGYPFGGLAGVGVAFKLVQALAEELPDRLPYPEEFLDLVALGTVADMAPLEDENRGLVQQGLSALRATHRPGLRALGEVSRRPVDQADTEAISFGYAPRLNAAGRLAHAQLAFDLVRATNAIQAEDLARQLNDLNQERRNLTADVVSAITETLRDDVPLVFAIDADYPAGITGLAAAKLVESTGRPAFVGTWVNGQIRGSARAPAAFHLVDLLGRHADLLESWGGHAAAAGFTVAAAQASALEAALTRDVADQADTAPGLATIEADCRVYPRTITWETYELVESLGPYGESHPRPRFVVENVSVGSTRVVGNDHLAIRFAELGTDVEAMWFGAEPLGRHLTTGRRVDAAFKLNLRTFRGASHVQMLIDDMRVLDLG